MRSFRSVSKQGVSLLVTWLLVAPVALSACLDLAETELEKIYCKVKASQHGASLPTLNDFRRNPESTQRLLLKRSAKRLGLTLPPAKKKPKAKVRPAAPSQPQQRHSDVASSALAKRCALHDDHIVCGSLRFNLANNRANRKLSAGALSQQNQLNLDTYEGSMANMDAVQSYLKRAYAQYLEKMIAIGLGASTMSYTKFYYTFQEVKKLDVSFEKRMQSMFEHLKKDKSTMAVSARYGLQKPDGMDQCMVVGSKYIVCDDVKHNWVYELANN